MPFPTSLKKNVNDLRCPLLPLCGGAITFIVIWHALSNCGFARVHHLPKILEFASYCCHGVLAVSAGAMLAHSSFPALRRISVIVASLLAMYWPALWAMYRTGAISERPFRLGLAVANVFRAEDLVALWFIQLLIVYFILAPLFLLTPNMKRRLITIAALAACLCMVKYKTQLIDIRLVLFLPVFVAGFTSLPECARMTSAFIGLPIGGAALTYAIGSSNSLEILSLAIGLCAVAYLTKWIAPIEIRDNIAVRILAALGSTWPLIFCIHRVGLHLAREMALDANWSLQAVTHLLLVPAVILSIGYAVGRITRISQVNASQLIRPWQTAGA